MTKIYLDYAASTPVDPRVLKYMTKKQRQIFANSSSLHSYGQEAKEVLEKARKKVATAINAKSEEVIFTSSVTESNNFVLKGIAFARQKKGNHIIISAIEHDCVLESARWLEKQGFKITKVSVDKFGLVDFKEIKRKIDKDTILVSIMHANNEIGVIEDIEKIAKITKEKGVYLHSDAAQTFGKIPVDVQKLGVDLLTASSHKMYGPKGVGFVYIKKGTLIDPLLHGGGHENNLRSSTVNVPAISAFAYAVELNQKEMKREKAKITKLRQKFEKQILKSIPDSFVNGDKLQRLPNISNIRFLYVEGESVLMHLDRFGIAVSTGSACSSKNLAPSHVLVEMKLKPEEIHGSIRFSFGRFTTEKEISQTIKILKNIIKDLRKISPYTGCE